MSSDDTCDNLRGQGNRIKEDAPPTLGTRIVAGLILQARQIPEFDSILATATRWHIPKDEDELVQEVMGYYFFPWL